MVGDHFSFIGGNGIRIINNNNAKTITISGEATVNLTPYTLLTTTAALTGQLTHLTTTASISANLQQQINSISTSTNGISSINNVSSSGGNIILVGVGGIIITNNNTTKTISISGGSSSTTSWSSLTQTETQNVTSQIIHVTQSSNRVYVGVNVTGGPVTVVMPYTPISLQEVLVKHEKGNISTNNITISGNGHNIDNFSTHIIDADDAAYHYIYSHNQWRIF